MQFDFTFDLLQQRLFQYVWRWQYLLIFSHRRIAGGQVIEQFCQVFADYRIVGQQPQVAILPGGAGMIVAGADMGVAFQAIVVASDHEDNLGVGFEADHAVSYVDSSLFKGLGPFDVGRLIETGHQLYDNGNLFAVVSRIYQILDDAGVGTGAVEGHFDYQHLGVGACLFQKTFHRGVERFIGVLEQDVLLFPENMKKIGFVDQELGMIAGLMGWVMKIRPVYFPDFH